MTEKFGIERIALVTVERILWFCGSAKCSRHNFVFLEGVKAALTADAAYAEGSYDTRPARGLRATARV